jgi:hypothetical protein
MKIVACRGNTADTDGSVLPGLTGFRFGAVVWFARTRRLRTRHRDSLDRRGRALLPSPTEEASANRNKFLRPESIDSINFAFR